MTNTDNIQISIDEYKDFWINNEIMIHITKSPDGYVVDVWNAHDVLLDTVPIWNDDLEAEE